MAASKPTKELHDYLECGICTDLLDVPKTLPCLHTFCLKCLEQHVQHSGSGSPRQANCPTCRESFTVETDVDKALKTNFFINNLIKMYKLSSKKDQCAKCDVCEKQVDKAGGHYCVVCQQIYCDVCNKAHVKITSSMSHRIKPLDEVNRESLNELSRASLLFCELHLAHPISLYCTSCSVKLCVICQVEGHQTHKCVSVEHKGKELKGQTEENLREIEKNYEDLLESMKTVEEQQVDFNIQLDEVSKAIDKREDELIKLVKVKSRQLKDLLQNMKTRNKDEYEQSKQKINQTIAALNSFKEMTRKLLDYGSNNDFIDAEQTLTEALVKSKQPTVKISGGARRISFKTADDDDGWFTQEKFGSVECDGRSTYFIVHFISRFVAGLATNNCFAIKSKSI